MHLFAILISSFEKDLFSSFAHFTIFDFKLYYITKRSRMEDRVGNQNSWALWFQNPLQDVGVTLG
jgi:hypothetical protein